MSEESRLEVALSFKLGGKVIVPADLIGRGLGVGLGTCTRALEVVAVAGFFEAFPFFFAIDFASRGVSGRKTRKTQEFIQKIAAQLC